MPPGPPGGNGGPPQPPPGNPNQQGRPGAGGKSVGPKLTPIKPTLHGYYFERKKAKDLENNQRPSWEFVNLSLLPVSSEILENQLREYDEENAKRGKTVLSIYESLGNGHRRGQIDFLISERQRTENHPWAQWELVLLTLEKRPSKNKSSFFGNSNPQYDTIAMRVFLRRSMKPNVVIPKDDVNTPKRPNMPNDLNQPGQPGPPPPQFAQVSGPPGPPPQHPPQHLPSMMTLNQPGMPGISGIPGVPNIPGPGPFPPMNPNFPVMPEGVILHQGKAPSMRHPPTAPARENPKAGSNRTHQKPRSKSKAKDRKLQFSTSESSDDQSESRWHSEDSESDSDDRRYDLSDGHGDDIVQIIDDGRASTKSRKKKRSNRKSSYDRPRSPSRSSRRQSRTNHLSRNSSRPHSLERHGRHEYRSSSELQSRPIPVPPDHRRQSSYGVDGGKLVPSITNAESVGDYMNPRKSMHELPRQAEPKQPIINISIGGDASNKANKEVTRKVQDWRDNDESHSDHDYDDAGDSIFSGVAHSDSIATPPSMPSPRTSIVYGEDPLRYDPRTGQHVPFKEHQKPGPYLARAPSPPLLTRYPSHKGRENVDYTPHTTHRVSRRSGQVEHSINGRRPSVRRSHTLDHASEVPRDYRLRYPQQKMLPGPDSQDQYAWETEQKIRIATERIRTQQNRARESERLIEEEALRRVREEEALRQLKEEERYRREQRIENYTNAYIVGRY
jgi:hypothetical protein